MNNFSNALKAPRPAPVFLRVINWLIDATIFSLIFTFIIYTFIQHFSLYLSLHEINFYFVHPRDEYYDSYLQQKILYILLYIITFVSYFSLFEGILSQTPGKFLTKTIVVNTDGFNTPTFSSILIRTLARLIPFEFISLISKRPRGLHDKLSSTMVTTIKELEEYERHKLNQINKNYENNSQHKQL